MQQERAKSAGKAKGDRPKSGLKDKGVVKADKNNEQLLSDLNQMDNLKFQYSYLCKRYATQPNKQINDAIELSLSKEKFINQLVVSNDNVKVSAIN